MKAELTKYKGREQSFIKHQFLSQYLQTAAYKTLQGRSPVFNFVDAFAGPWKVSGDDYSDASFDQALRTLESVRADLQNTGVKDLKVRFCFCEKRRTAVSKLQEYAESRSECEIYVFHGSFEDHLHDVGNICGDGFTFTFIDPTGWNIRSEPILEFLKERDGEFLLNFMAEPVNRHAGYSLVAESFGRFLADPDWEEQFNNLPVEWSNERCVLHLLRKKIKDKGAARYVPDFPILNPSENRVKMRLLLGTHLAKGLEVFREVEKNVERLQMETRDQIRHGARAQFSLFTPEEIAALQQGVAGVGCQKYRDEAEKRVVSRLQAVGSTGFAPLANLVMEELPMRPPDVKSLLLEMKKRGVVDFELPAGRRVPQPETLVYLLR